MELDALNLLTSEAILRAEALTDIGAPGAEASYLDVSLLEDQIAQATDPSSTEGALARQGAVGAAVLAGRTDRAEQLVILYSAQVGATDELRDELAGLIIRLTELRFQDRGMAIARGFPSASARYGAEAIVRLAETIVRQAEPLPIG